jgi:hypothetical protein
VVFFTEFQPDAGPIFIKQGPDTDVGISPQAKAHLLRVGAALYYDDHVIFDILEMDALIAPFPQEAAYLLSGVLHADGARLDDHDVSRAAAAHVHYH